MLDELSGRTGYLIPATPRTIQLARLHAEMGRAGLGQRPMVPWMIGVLDRLLLEAEQRVADLEQRLTDQPSGITAEDIGMSTKESV